jgi:hypothetical protein
MEINERPNIHQVIAQLRDDIDCAGYHMAEGSLLDCHSEATKEFAHGCLKILIGVAAVLVFALEDANET